jgi:hypothetical protein
MLIKKDATGFQTRPFYMQKKTVGRGGSHGIVLSQFSVVSGLTTFITDVLLV